MRTLDFVAGLTIPQAFSRACNFVRNTGEPVLADINDIIMIINKDTDLHKAVIDYRQKLEFKYEIERMKKNECQLYSTQTVTLRD